MSTQNAFLKDTEHLSKRLADSERRRQKAERALQLTHTYLTKNRANALQDHVRNLLPSLDTETITHLKSKIPSFVTPTTTREIESALSVGVPFFTWLRGHGREYKTTILNGKMDILRVRLAAHIDTLNPKPEWCADLQKLDEAILETQQKLEKINAEKEKIASQMQALERAKKAYASKDKNDTRKKIAQAISESARNDRARASRRYREDTGRPIDDTDDFFCDVVLPVMVIASLMPDHHDHADHSDTSIGTVAHTASTTDASPNTDAQEIVDADTVLPEATSFDGNATDRGDLS